MFIQCDRDKECIGLLQRSMGKAIFFGVILSEFVCFAKESEYQLSNEIGPFLR
jgi:hypothetical protein